jgi:hypothetical protein
MAVEIMKSISQPGRLQIAGAMGRPTRHLRGLSGGVALVKALCAVLEREA